MKASPSVEEGRSTDGDPASSFEGSMEDDPGAVERVEKREEVGVEAFDLSSDGVG